MKKPFIKSILSYIWEQPIESTSSAYNPELHVILVSGRYQLCTKNAIYSFEDKYANYTKAFKKIDLEKANFKKVLILGFGLGSIPFMLEKTFKKKYDYTGIEIDEEVIALASKYLVPNMESKMDLILGDAYQFVFATNEKYDLIAVDIFQDAVIPKNFEQAEFLHQLKEILSKKGLIMYNRLFHNKQDEKDTKEYYQSVFSQCFPESDYFSIGGNWILLNHRNLLI